MVAACTAVCLQLPLPQDALAAAASRADVSAIVKQQVAIADREITLAKNTGPCDLFLFPEFFFTGGRGPELLGALDNPGCDLEQIQALAARHAVFIGANVYARTPLFPGRYLNTSFLFDRTGQTVLTSYRMHTYHSHSPHDFWQEFLDKLGLEGAFPVARTALGNIAILPSMELIYPEMARMFVLGGAEILLHTTAEQIVDQSVKRARAIENMAFLVSCNTSERSGPEPFMDVGSRIIDWRGSVLAQVPQGHAAHARAALDLQGLQRDRADMSLAYTGAPPNYLVRLRMELFAAAYGATSLFPPNTYDGNGPTAEKVEPTLLKPQLGFSLKHMAALGMIPHPPD